MKFNTKIIGYESKLLYLTITKTISSSIINILY